MPLNKLDNFLKNTEGRILYVNPNDLDATDAITNQGNSLAQPFKTIQRALLEAARFSYVRGSNNDLVEKTTILLFPGSYIVDNRPGFAVKNVGGVAKAVSPSGTETIASETLSLTLESIFDLNQTDNILYKFNSVNGGVVVPRGTSIVGLDLRKTKIRPKYVPNPTDSNVNKSSIFRLTGACYFWQLSFFDGEESGLVYTDDSDFSRLNQSTPTFSHHKLSCFEYADGVNKVQGYDLTDLDMYYSKLSNAFNLASGRDIDQKYPTDSLGFAKKRSEYEIVGAFASDPITVSNVTSGDGITPSSVITVTTSIPHNLTTDTPVKITGVGVRDYNITTKVQNVLNSTQFTYLLPFVRPNLPASPSSSSATVTIETDTVSGASPYVFNCSLRSVYGLNGLHADGKKATGFRSVVLAQFTGVSLQKDDRAFVKYNKSSRLYEGIIISKVTGAELTSGSSSTDTEKVYHLDSDAVYRNGWESVHIKCSNDAFIQVVSVFGVGFAVHFEGQSGGDQSITNSNSNFGQYSLRSSGFKKESFLKDDTAYVTSIIAPRAIKEVEENIDWISLDVGLTTSVGKSNQLYLYGFTSADDVPPSIIQGYRIGAKQNDKLYVNVGGIGTYTANIYMCDTFDGTTAGGTNSSKKEYTVSGAPSSNIFTFTTNHGLKSGEKVKIFSTTGDYPENINEKDTYYVITSEVDGSLGPTQIQLATSENNAFLGSELTVYGGSGLSIVSRVSEKNSGDIGSPIQYDTVNKNWFVHTNSGNAIYNALATYGVSTLGDRTEEVSFVKRSQDKRSLEEKIYKMRVVIPKEATNSRNPVEGYIIQETSETGARSNLDFTLTSIASTDYRYNRNPKFISNCTTASSTVTVVSELPHNLNAGDQIIVKNVTSTTNSTGEDNLGFNGTFTVASVIDSLTFTHSIIDVDGISHNTGTFTNNTSVRTTALPRFERNDLQSNYFIYRSQVISQYVEGVQDGVYHVYVLNSNNAVPTEFTTTKYAQKVEDLYPQLDRDNIDDNPRSAKSFAKRSPLGEVATNDLKKSITRETVDLFLKDFAKGLSVSAVAETSTQATITFNKEHGLSGIVTYSSLTGGSGHTNGTFYNVKLYNNAALSSWDGATAKVVVSGGAVTQVDVQAPGSGYVNGETLYIDSGVIGGSPNATITLATAGISTSVGSVIQFTGAGTTSDTYHRIVSVPSKVQVAVARTTGDTTITNSQYGFVIGPAIAVTSSSYNSSTGILTINCSGGHGLLGGNKFRIVDSSNNNLGDYIVESKVDYNSFTVLTNKSLSPTYVLKHGLSSNNAISDVRVENLAVRGFTLYDNETLTAVSFTSDTQIRISHPNAGISTTKRFPLGTYIQIDNEIMRITSSTLSGSGNDEITVLRGQLGTLKSTHENGSLIRKISPIPVEFRRPSILRASGHTFEYLGYGPGNYSTALPQVQVKSLTENEEFFAQAQETSCGSVLYSAMSSNGDFYNGNKKLNSSTGQEKTFKIPVPTVTGQDASRLSVVFDEVIIKERLLVEGGNSSTVLSQFDGPVTFNQELKMNDFVTINNSAKITGRVEITNTTDSTNKDTGALIINGGVGIEKKLNVGDSVTITNNLLINGTTQATSKDTGSLIINGGAGIEKDVHIGGDTQSTNCATGALVVAGGAGIGKNANICGNLTVSGDATIGGSLNAGSNNITSGGGIFGNIRIAIADDNTIDTTTGNLTINTQGGTVIIQDDLQASGTLVIGGTGSFGGSISASGNGTFTGDVIAFASDERLKTNIKPLENALDKVLQLNGFTYNFNEVAEKLGFNTEDTHVGVSAQQIQKVLPEAVKPCPADENYITVQYEKIVPLLIEAIKELSAKVDALESKLG